MIKVDKEESPRRANSIISSALAEALHTERAVSAVPTGRARHIQSARGIGGALTDEDMSQESSSSAAA